MWQRYRFILKHTFFSNVTHGCYYIRVTWDAASNCQALESCPRPLDLNNWMWVPEICFFFPKAPWTLIHLLELPKTEHRQFQVLVIMWNNRNSHSLLAGIQNDTAIWKTVQWFLTILKRILPHDLAIALLVFTQKKLKTRPFKNLHMDIYSSFFFS